MLNIKTYNKNKDTTCLLEHMIGSSSVGDNNLKVSLVLGTSILPTLFCSTTWPIIYKK